jgi:hypothetical protein
MCVLAIIFATFSIPFAKSTANDVIRIADAQGEGKNAEEALKGAFTNAVQRAVGLYLTADEKLDNNGDAIQEIATFSNGYIVWYEKLNLSDTQDGNKRVLIACDVSRSKTVARLEKAGVKVSQAEAGKVDGKPLFAQEVTKNKLREDSARLLSQLLSRIPSTKDMLRGAELLPRKLEPREESNDSGYACDVYYRLNYNYESLTQYCKWVDKTLQHAGFTDRYERSFKHKYIDADVRDKVTIDSNLDRREYSSFLDLHNTINKSAENQGVLVLLTDFQCDDMMDVKNVMKDGKAFDDRPHIKTTWVVYKLEISILRQVEREVVRTAYNSRVSFEGGYKHYDNWKPLETEVAIQFKDGKGKEVVSETITFPESSNFAFIHFFDKPVSLEDQGNALWISFIFWDDDINKIIWNSAHLTFRNPNKSSSVKLKLSDLELIEKVNVRIIK